MNRELSNSDENPTTGKLASVPDDTSGADQDTPSFPSDSTQYALRGASSRRKNMPSGKLHADVPIGKWKILNIHITSSEDQAQRAPSKRTGLAGKTIHHDWRFWVFLILMVAAMVIYIASEDLSMGPRGTRPPGLRQPVPENVAP